MIGSREQLLTIKSLAASGLDKMDDAQFKTFCEALEEFIEVFPTQEAELKAAFESRDGEAFSKKLLVVLDSLAKIRANELAQSSFKVLSEFRNGNYSVAEALLTSFSTTISEFSIDIQMAQYKKAPPPRAPKEPLEQKLPTEVAQRERSILAVDDASFLLAMLKLALQDYECKFTGVTSGKAALRFLETHSADLFILDIEMPEMNGYELAAKIRQAGHKAPIIFLTGNSTKEYVLKAVQVGAAGFIVKPIDKAKVLEKIQKYLV